MAGDVECDNPNMLASARSPYLRMHACDPVRWVTWEWVEERLGSIGKPLFVSIGYSSCHWCHVMQRESFRNPVVAEWLNRVFVPVKVDREERPDVDEYYMAYCQAVRGACGWPLNVLADEHGRPFAAFTYLPPGELVRVAMAVEDAWRRGEPQRVAEYAGKVLGEALTRAPHTGPPVDDLFDSLLDWARKAYDAEYGGFGAAPKFPMAPLLEALLAVHYRRGLREPLSMVLETLHWMASGGIHDWVGGGFHRYSVDRYWRLPHFEKMLYDQACIARVLGAALRIARDPVLLRAAQGIVRFLEREMLGEAGFYSALDAESGGVEGLYYTWTVEELRDALGGLYPLAEKLFNVEPQGNYLDEATRERTGRNLLYVGEPLPRAAERLGLSLDELLSLIDEVSERLLEARKAKPRPAADYKVLASWNGLALWGLASLAAAGVDGALDLAVEAARRLEAKLLDGCEPRRAYARGEAYGEPLLPDYTHLALGMLGLHSVTGRDRFLELAHCLARGALRFQASDGSLRLKPGGIVERSEGAYPTGYSMGVEAMARLGRLLDDNSLLEAARRAAGPLAGLAAEAPAGMPYALVALDLLEGPSFDVVLAEGEGWMRALEGLAAEPRHYVTLAVNREDGYLWRTAGYARSMPALAGRATIYVCEEGVCSLPTHSVEKALAYVRRRGARRGAL